MLPFLNVSMGYVAALSRLCEIMYCWAALYIAKLEAEFFEVDASLESLSQVRARI